MNLRRVVHEGGVVTFGARYSDDRYAYRHDHTLFAEGEVVWFQGGRWYGDFDRILLYDGPHYGAKMLGYADAMLP